MRIVFVEPGAGPKPVGGTRIVYEQANRLAQRGHEVTVIHPVKLEPARQLSKRLRLWLRYRSRARSGKWKPSRWMKVDPRVRMLWTPDLKPERFPPADVVIATTWNLVEPVAALPRDRGRKVFYAQSWDFGAAPEDALMAAWHAPFRRIVNNRAMQHAAAALGLDAIYVPNGLALEPWGIDVPLAARDAAHMAMLLHGAWYKGAEDCIAALTIARQAEPRLTAEAFGTEPRPPNLPRWIAYSRLPSRTELRALYNRAAVFVSASRIESWGLAPCEAGFCGCAIAVTDNFGHREYATDDETALVSAVGDVEALAANIVRLAKDDALRERLNTGLRQQLAEFSWRRSSELFEQALTAA